MARFCPRDWFCPRGFCPRGVLTLPVPIINHTLSLVVAAPTPEITMPIDDEPEIPFCEVHEIIVPHLGHVPIAKGDFTALPKKIQQFIAYYVSRSQIVIGYRIFHKTTETLECSLISIDVLDKLILIFICLNVAFMFLSFPYNNY